MERNIGFKERRYIEELRILTKSTALDCVIDERFCRVIYVVKIGDMGLAIGKKGENIRRMQNVLGKRVEMVEYADSMDEFVASIHRPAEIDHIQKKNSELPDRCVSKRTAMIRHCNWERWMQYREGSHTVKTFFWC